MTGARHRHAADRGGGLSDGGRPPQRPVPDPVGAPPSPSPAIVDVAELRTVLVDLLATIDAAAAGAWADRLIASFGTLARIGAVSSSRLAALVGAPAAELLAAHRAALLFALREPAVRGPLLATRHELTDYLHHRMAHDPVESLRVFFLNGRRELLAEEVIARGGPAGIAADPRQVLVRALELGATGLILVHNHPSGDATPSAADRRFTRSLAVAGDCLGVRLHDHLVVARDGIRSVDVDPA